MGCVIQVKKHKPHQDPVLLRSFLVRTGPGSSSPGSPGGGAGDQHCLHHHKQGLRQWPQGNQPGHCRAEPGSPDCHGGRGYGESLQLSLHSGARPDSLRWGLSHRHLQPRRADRRLHWVAHGEVCRGERLTTVMVSVVLTLFRIRPRPWASLERSRTTTPSRVTGELRRLLRVECSAVR